ncbi:hypothetical protein H7Y63_01355, partial [Polaromonas sp.]|nr:hypothetical protein [Candidatus Saccharibacteria bacterium]
MNKSRRIAYRSAAVAVALVVLAPAVFSSFASAATLTAVTVRFDRMKISTPTTGTVCAKPTSTATEATVKVTYPTGYALGAAATFTVDTTTNITSWPTGAAAWTGITTASNVTGQVVTFGSGDLTAAQLYCFNWINSAAVSIKGSATSSNSGAVETFTGTPTSIDVSSFSTPSIAEDQIVVTATVPQAFSFALSGNADAIGVITSGTPKTGATPITVTINTNA